MSTDIEQLRKKVSDLAALSLAAHGTGKLEADPELCRDAQEYCRVLLEEKPKHFDGLPSDRLNTAIMMMGVSIGLALNETNQTIDALGGINHLADLLQTEGPEAIIKLKREHDNK